MTLTLNLILTLLINFDTLPLRADPNKAVKFVAGLAWDHGAAITNYPKFSLSMALRQRGRNRRPMKTESALFQRAVASGRNSFF
jgi:hypothetical protein